ATTIADRFRKDLHYERFERGELTSGEYFALLRHQLGLDVEIDAIADGWHAIFGELVPGITEAIAAVRDSPYRLAALSNINATPRCSPTSVASWPPTNSAIASPNPVAFSLPPNTWPPTRATCCSSTTWPRTSTAPGRWGCRRCGCAASTTCVRRSTRSASCLA